MTRFILAPLGWLVCWWVSEMFTNQISDER